MLMDNIGKVKEFAILDFKISEMCLKVKTKPTVIIFFEDETATSLVSSFPDLFFFLPTFPSNSKLVYFLGLSIIMKTIFKFQLKT